MKKKVPARKRVVRKSPERPATNSSADVGAPVGHSLAGVVGVGASAGGLEALANFLRGMPGDSGLAIIIVTHQHPGHTSLLPELLRKHTLMPVTEVSDGMSLKPNHVYLSRPEFCVGVERSVVRLSSLDVKAGLSLPIDHLFRSLADDLKEHAIGIVLSGTGTDGTLGLRAIKGAGGLALAQSPDSARFAGMPQSAVATGVVDFVGAADQMAKPLLNHIRGIARSGTAKEGLDDDLQEPMQKIFALLRTRTGHDFSNYKPNTIRRRLERRMSLQQIDRIAQYVLFLQEHQHEVDLLGKELLIGVTNFFRDPEAFETLTREGLLPAFRELHEDSHVRVWVPGCSSVEEAFSLAIVFQECAAELGIFLTCRYLPPILTTRRSTSRAAGSIRTASRWM